MLFKTFAIFQICLVLCQAELLKRYPSQTIIQVSIHPTDKQKVCKCSGRRCNVDEQAAEQVCKVLKNRFVYYGHPSSYFVLCEFNPKTCQQMNGDNPRAYIIDLFFDTYYLKRSTIYVGNSTGERVLTELFKLNTKFPSPVFESKPLSIETTFGIVGMPIEIEAILNIKIEDFAKYDLCYEYSCHKTINELCDGFIRAMKTAYQKFMKANLGCHVRRIYTHQKNVHLSISIMMHHRYVVENKLAESMQGLYKVTNAATRALRLPHLVRSYRVTGVLPLDFCEISATSLTTQKYHHEMRSPISIPYRVSGYAYYTELTNQLVVGDLGIPHCAPILLGLDMTNVDGLTKVSFQMWVSLGCYKYRRIKTCKDVVMDIKNRWRRGNLFYYDIWAPWYDFELLHENASF